MIELYRERFELLKVIYESFLRKFVDDGDFEFVRIKVGEIRITEIRIRESHVNIFFLFHVS